MLHFLATVVEMWLKPFQTTRVNAIFMKLPYKEAMVNGIKGFFEIDKDNTFNQTIVGVDRPAICGFNKCSKCTM